MKDEHDDPKEGDAPHPGSWEGPSKASPYPLSRLAPRFDLVDDARVVAIGADDHRGVLGRAEHAERHLRGDEAHGGPVEPGAHGEPEHALEQALEPRLVQPRRPPREDARGGARAHGDEVAEQVRGHAPAEPEVEEAPHQEPEREALHQAEEVLQSRFNPRRLAWLPSHLDRPSSGKRDAVWRLAIPASTRNAILVYGCIKIASTRSLL